ncbi:MerR family transcriptional regulator [Flavobacteriales bacterium]|jgi:DNA-binding transcriptional MerR regulator|nr:MerR family transcriptional regulator [Flavobacteriales bacterium]MDB4795970.1 MerR family transcriptional regulator [Flavobacteriales bacterium]
MPLNKPIQKQYFSITEVAEKMGLNASQLRYWEKEFTALKPKTNARGKRFYNQSDIEIIGQINWLVKDQGYTISGARKAMRKRSEVAGQMASAAELQAAEAPREFNREMLLSRLNSVRSELESIQATLAD